MLPVLDQGFTNDPYPIFEHLRQNKPVGKTTPLNYWYITRYEDITYILSKPNLFSSQIMNNPDMFVPEVRPFLEADNILGLDPPKHGPLRRIVQRAFSVQKVTALDQQVADICQQLVDDMPKHGSVDFMQHIAMALPVRVISKFLGVDNYPFHRNMQDAFKQWTDDILISRVLQSLPESPAKAARIAEIQKRCQEFDDFFNARIEERRKTPTDDVLSSLVSEAERGEKLQSRDILSMTRLILGAGTETTTALLNNALKVLATHPHIYDALKADLNLIDPFIEEVLRFDSPALGLFRTATKDIEIGEEMIAKGDHLYALVASANRDESIFPDPNSFILDRVATSPHLGFGFGIHSCLGAMLARMEAKEIFRSILTKLGRPIIGEEINYEHFFLVRSMKKMIVHFENKSVATIPSKVAA